MTLTMDVFPGHGNSTRQPWVPAAKDPFDTPLPGLSVEVMKKPMFLGNEYQSANGMEIRVSYSEWPRWEFELSYEFLEDKSGAQSSLKSIIGFFVDVQGSFLPWLFKDPDDYLVTAGVLGEADGVSDTFYFRRYLGRRGEPVGMVDTDNNVTLFLDGVLIDPSDYTVIKNKAVFDTPPSSGVITGDFQFFFVCRFLENEMEFEKFADSWWNLQTCSFKSVIT